MSSFESYAHQRLRNALTFAHWQRAPYSEPVRRVRISTTDGVELAGTLLSRGHPNLIIVCHGFASTQRSLGIVWLAESLVEWWDVLTFNWRGYGESGGRASLGGDEAHDLMAALSYGRAQNYRAVGVIGESMGGFITLATLGAHADATQNGLPYPDRIATLGAPADLLKTGFPRPQMVRHLAPRPWLRPASQLMGYRSGPPRIPDLLGVVGNIRIPLMMLHGERDTIVPVRNAYRIHERNPAADLRIYPRVGHGVEAMRLQLPQRLRADLREHFRMMS